MFTQSSSSPPLSSPSSSSPPLSSPSSSSPPLSSPSSSSPPLSSPSSSSPPLSSPSSSSPPLSSPSSSLSVVSSVVSPACAACCANACVTSGAIISSNESNTCPTSVGGGKLSDIRVNAAVALVVVETKYPLLISFGAKLVPYVISTSLAGIASTVWLVCGFMRFTVTSTLFTICMLL